MQLASVSSSTEQVEKHLYLQMHKHDKMAKRIVMFFISWYVLRVVRMKNPMCCPVSIANEWLVDVESWKMWSSGLYF